MRRFGMKTPGVVTQTASRARSARRWWLCDHARARPSAGLWGVVRGDTYLQRVINVISLERLSALPPLDEVETLPAQRVDALDGAGVVGEFRVRRVTVAGTGAASWSLLGADRVVVEPVERVPGVAVASGALAEHGACLRA
jgi:hypothetical protein